MRSVFLRGGEEGGQKAVLPWDSSADHEFNIFVLQVVMASATISRNALRWIFQSEKSAIKESIKMQIVEFLTDHMVGKTSEIAEYIG